MEDDAGEDTKVREEFVVLLLIDAVVPGSCVEKVFAYLAASGSHSRHSLIFRDQTAVRAGAATPHPGPIRLEDP